MMLENFRQSFSVVASESIKNIQTPGEFISILGKVIAPLQNGNDYITKTSCDCNEENQYSYGEDPVHENKTQLPSNVIRVNNYESSLKDNNDSDLSCHDVPYKEMTHKNISCHTKKNETLNKTKINICEDNKLSVKKMEESLSYPLCNLIPKNDHLVYSLVPYNDSIKRAQPIIEINEDFNLKESSKHEKYTAFHGIPYTNEIHFRNLGCQDFENELRKSHIASLNVSERKLVYTIMTLKERDTEFNKLNILIKKIKNETSVKYISIYDAEKLQNKNNMLQKKINILNNEKKILKEYIFNLEKRNRNLMENQTDIDLLREEIKKERETTQTKILFNSSFIEKTIEERDAANAKLFDLKQKVSSLSADYGVIKDDFQRTLKTNANLQRTHESFQNDHEAELTHFFKSRKSSRNDIKIANKASLLEVKNENKLLLIEIEKLLENYMTNVISQLRKTEKIIEKYRRDYLNMYCNLNEDISCLQNSKYDIINRSLMKSIFIDWYLKKGKARHNVMLIISNILQFTKDEKVIFGFAENSEKNRLSYVGALVPDIFRKMNSYDQAKGNNIREKLLLLESNESSETKSRNRNLNLSSKKMAAIVL